MARPLRIDQEDTCYHVLNRGNERRAIFRDDGDREGFLTRLGRDAEQFGLGVYAYVLMRTTEGQSLFCPGVTARMHMTLTLSDALSWQRGLRS